jgi:heme-degrading monooxygenase HmoA
MTLVEDVLAVLTTYDAYLPLTVRQIFYRLVATIGFDKTEAAYARLCETVGRARRAGLIDFSTIRDDGAARYEVTFWSSLEDFLDGVRNDAQAFRLDRQAGQPVRLWTLCEAGGMAPMLARVASSFGVPVLSSGGFDSLTAKHTLAEELSTILRSGVRAEVLHVGDLDPSGEHLFTSLAEDVSAMCRALCGAEPEFARLAVTRAQAVEMDLPTAPAKQTDRRRFTGETVQAEAIAPDVLTQILRAAIEARRDRTITKSVLVQETDMRIALLARLSGGA